MSEEKYAALLMRALEPRQRRDEIMDAPDAGMSEEIGKTQVDVPLRGVVLRLGAEGGQQYTLGRNTVVGRLDSADIPIQDSSVSREHARFTLVLSGYILEDLASTNGTFVNGRRIDEPVPVTAGDIIRFGSIDFRFDTVPFVAPHEAIAVTDTVADTLMGVSLSPATQQFESVQPETSPATVPAPSEEIPVAAEAPAPSVSPGAPAGRPAEAIVSEANETVQRLANLLQDLEHGLAASESQQQALKEPLHRALQELPNHTLTPEQVHTVHDLVRDLVQNPRDVGQLSNISKQAAALETMVDEYVQLRRTLDELSQVLEQ